MTSRIRYRREKLNKDLHPHRPTWIQKAHILVNTVAN
uniref:Uncharacterized protein n=1 Tax=Anguilla anguilla TaxID=7936 RepID=A0A0E9UB38_ANGAN